MQRIKLIQNTYPLYHCKEMQKQTKQKMQINKQNGLNT